MVKAGRQPEGKPYSVKTILGFLGSWKTLLFTLIFTMQPFGSQPFTAFVFWLKAHNVKGKPLVYTVSQIVGYYQGYSVLVTEKRLTLFDRMNTRQSAMPSHASIRSHVFGFPMGRCEGGDGRSSYSRT
jgi:hypothetical protein